MPFENESRRNPSNGRKLFGVDLTDAIVDHHVRPHVGGAMLTGDEQVPEVPDHLIAVIEQGWAHELDERLTTTEMKEVLRSELGLLGCDVSIQCCYDVSNCCIVPEYSRELRKSMDEEMRKKRNLHTKKRRNLHAN